MKRVFNINLHYACNNACINCISHNTKSNSSSIISVTNIQNLLENFVPKEEDIIILSGGEPSLYPDLISLLQLIRKHTSCQIVMYTNGFGLCSEIITEAIVRYINRVTISFYGNDSVHDFYAGKIGAFSTLKSAIHKFCKLRTKFKSKCLLELKYVSPPIGTPILSILDSISSSHEIDSIVLSRILTINNYEFTKYQIDDITISNINLLQYQDRYKNIPLKLVDLLPCTLGNQLFNEIFNSNPQRLAYEILFFDGNHPEGMPIQFAKSASFSARCALCKLKTICGTTLTCYGALCKFHGKWHYADE